jgi:hypothetical protein
LLVFNAYLSFFFRKALLIAFRKLIGVLIGRIDDGIDIERPRLVVEDFTDWFVVS